jgi:hypothetical protein
VIKFVAFYMPWLTDVVAEELEPRVFQEVFDVAPVRREHVIHANDVRTGLEEDFTQMRTYKSGPTGDNDLHRDYDTERRFRMISSSVPARTDHL